MIDGRQLITRLWNFVMGLLESIGDVWDWLNSPISLGLKIELLGIDWTVSFTPLVGFSGSVVILLVTLALVKTFIPVA